MGIDSSQSFTQGAERFLANAKELQNRARSSEPDTASAAQESLLSLQRERVGQILFLPYSLAGEQITLRRAELDQLCVECDTRGDVVSPVELERLLSQVQRDPAQSRIIIPREADPIHPDSLLCTLYPSSHNTPIAAAIDLTRRGVVAINPNLFTEFDGPPSIAFDNPIPLQQIGPMLGPKTRRKFENWSKRFLPRLLNFSDKPRRYFGAIHLPHWFEGDGSDVRMNTLPHRGAWILSPELLDPWVTTEGMPPALLEEGEDRMARMQAERQ